jgi:hypothetical protein
MQKSSASGLLQPSTRLFGCQPRCMEPCQAARPSTPTTAAHASAWGPGGASWWWIIMPSSSECISVTMPSGSTFSPAAILSARLRARSPSLRSGLADRVERASPAAKVSRAMQANVPAPCAASRRSATAAVSTGLGQVTALHARRKRHGARLCTCWLGEPVIGSGAVRFHATSAFPAATRRRSPTRSDWPQPSLASEARSRIQAVARPSTAQSRSGMPIKGSTVKSRASGLA